MNMITMIILISMIMVFYKNGLHTDGELSYLYSYGDNGVTFKRIRFWQYGL